MIIELGHMKGLALFGAMVTFINNRQLKSSYSEEPHFDNDPVPGDSFPSYIFNKG